jgi:hypothetical protein
MKVGPLVYNTFTNLQAEVTDFTSHDVVWILGLPYTVHVDKEEAVDGAYRNMKTTLQQISVHKSGQIVEEYRWVCCEGSGFYTLIIRMRFENFCERSGFYTLLIRMRFENCCEGCGFYTLLIQMPFENCCECLQQGFACFHFMPFEAITLYKGVYLIHDRIITTAAASDTEHGGWLLEFLSRTWNVLDSVCAEGVATLRFFMDSVLRCKCWNAILVIIRIYEYVPIHHKTIFQFDVK